MCVGGYQDSINDHLNHNFDGLGVVSVMHVSSHLGCMCLCILVACIFASLETLRCSQWFCSNFQRSKDACILTSWLQSFFHVGCGHPLWLMIFATILIASWLRASFCGRWLLLQLLLLIWYCKLKTFTKGWSVRENNDKELVPHP